ncbi:synaptotagmin-like protein 3 isoform X3 [Ctenopharyngodon idella]|uniref:synaptotagmin-like protein 3 isoform X3 n=1 Tax=Ctenopharyngodon idella TaxID=7959 RepID=UPI002230DE29|nr:synaptotagmin-like protein 3 isoform X3 [Ctenopharyngodon idella]
MKLKEENWDIRYNHLCPMDLGLFQALERERVLEVLQRDKALRTIEADRIRRLKVELQGIYRQGAKTITRPYGQRSCARCQRHLGKFWDCGSVCCGCSHRICNRCRVVLSAREWKCTMCHAFREFKIKSGEWFLEQQAKKFPDVKELSKSQNDLSVEAGQLTVDYGRMNSRRKSLSMGALDKASNLSKAPSLPNLSQDTKAAEQYTSASTICLTDDDVSYTSAYSDEQRDSNSSTGMDCGFFENTCVTGEIEVAFGYNNRTSCLEITIKACKNLMIGDTKKKCHPYVKLRLLPKKYHNYKMKTAIKRGNNPVYNETFTCVVDREQLVSCVVQASVWHSRGLKRKLFLGETLIRLADLCLESTDTQRSVWNTLGPKQGHALGGDVELYTSELLLKAQLQFLPQTSPHTDDILIGSAGQLKLVITDVWKLLSVSKTAYIEGILCLSGDKELVQRTPLKKTADSVQIKFRRVTRQELQQATLQLNLWEKNTFSLSDRLLRSGRLGGAESSWQRLQQMPGEWHDFVLPLHADVSTNMRS